MGDVNPGEASGSTAAAPQAQATGVSEGQPVPGFAGALKFQQPKNFDGKEQHFEEWAYKLRAYLSLSNPKFKSMMMIVEKESEAVDFNRMREHEKIMGAQLQNVLISLCEGPASKLFIDQITTSTMVSSRGDYYLKGMRRSRERSRQIE